MAEKYTGPVVFITHALFTEGLRNLSELNRRQEAPHRAKILELLRFAVKHNLPVFYVSNYKTKGWFYELAEKAGISRREVAEAPSFVPGHRLPENFFRQEARGFSFPRHIEGGTMQSRIREVFDATRVIHAGARRFSCVKNSLQDAGRI